MYVAATRAKDYLVVSLYRLKKSTKDNSYVSQLEEICGQNGAFWNEIECLNPGEDLEMNSVLYSG